MRPLGLIVVYSQRLDRADVVGRVGLGRDGCDHLDLLRGDGRWARRGNGGFVRLRDGVTR